MRKTTKMEGNMMESYVDPKIILGRVQRQMKSLSISSRAPYSSKAIKEKGHWKRNFSRKTSQCEKYPCS
jgi:hypothetical protein